MSKGDADFCLLVKLAERFAAKEEEKERLWEDSPFKRLALGLSSGRKGTFFQDLIAAWCTEHQIDAGPSVSSGANRTINGLQVEIKGSTLWTGNKVYKFQQIRDQDYQLLICLGISPSSAHAWVIPKDVVMDAWHKELEGIESQHGGRRGKDTAWLSFPATTPPQWLSPYGGSLADICPLIQKFSS